MFQKATKFVIGFVMGTSSMVVSGYIGGLFTELFPDAVTIILTTLEILSFTLITFALPISLFLFFRERDRFIKYGIIASAIFLILLPLSYTITELFREPATEVYPENSTMLGEMIYRIY